MAPTPLSFTVVLLALKSLCDLFGRYSEGSDGSPPAGLPTGDLRGVGLGCPAGAFAGVPTAAGVGDGFAEAFAGGAVCVLALPAFFGVGVGFAPVLALAGTGRGSRLCPAA